MVVAALVSCCSTRDCNLYRSLAPHTRPRQSVAESSLPMTTPLSGMVWRAFFTARVSKWLVMHTEPMFILGCLRAGMVGYIVKAKSTSTLVEAIEAVRNGETYLSSDVSKTIVDAYLAKDDAPLDPLSTREREVLQLIAEGKNVKEIGCVLGISTKTAESHRTNIMSKLDIHQVAGLVRYALRSGLTQAD